MCKTRSSRRITIHTAAGPRELRLDPCMIPFINSLNENSRMDTLGCCCGHDRYHKTVVVTRKGRIWELISGIDIPRKRRYYLMDKEGLFYYIPEVEEHYALQRLSKRQKRVRSKEGQTMEWG